MKITISVVHPTGLPVQVELTSDECAKSDDVIERLLKKGYRPPPTDWQRTPDGLPLCPKHGVAMSQREKQGDCWHSHRIVTEAGEELWCRGFAWGPAEKDGFQH